jgi:hypothetical protein
MLERLKNFWNGLEAKTNRNNLFWWILVWIQIAGLFVAYQAGIMTMIWHEDVTRLTLVIFIIHAFTTIKTGLDTANKNKDWLDPLWLAADQIFAVGILGTLCGFIILMHEAFIGGIPTTPVQIQKMLATMSSGMATAFWVSACAITSSMIQKVQVMNLELALRNEQESR